jgi:hypothetical protein
MKCPLCGSKCFYVKDPDNAFEMYEFEIVDGKIVFQDVESDPPQIDEETEIYCNECAWHGKLRELKP